MENKNHPKIEEVIAYFKDAEEVECLCYGIKRSVEINKEIIKKVDDSFWFFVNENTGIMIYSGYKNKYAKITKYKTEINLSKITPDLIRELNKEPNIHNILVKEGVVKPKLEFNKWYININKSIDNMIFYKSDNEDCYGFGYSRGDWHNDLRFNQKEHKWRLATPTEVIERIKAEAVKKF